MYVHHIRFLLYMHACASTLIETLERTFYSPVHVCY